MIPSLVALVPYGLKDGLIMPVNALGQRLEGLVILKRFGGQPRSIVPCFIQLLRERR